MRTSPKPWSEEQIRILRARYPGEPSTDLVVATGHSVRQIYWKAGTLGLKKSAEYLASESARAVNRLGNAGARSQFTKGHATWNKGIAYVAGGRSVDTQFRPGNRPRTWRPIGSERMMDGYLQRKVAHTGDSIRDFVSVHVLVWQEHNGPVPAGRTVVFKDGDRTNVDITNLECITRADLMRRNTVHRLPKELADLAQLRGVLNRQINKRSQA